MKTNRLKQLDTVHRISRKGLSSMRIANNFYISIIICLSAYQPNYININFNK